MDQPTLSPPVLLTWAGNAFFGVCAQAEYSGTNSPVLIYPIDYSGETDEQKWQFGSDQRIYVYSSESPAAYCLSFDGSAQSVPPLILTTPDASDKTQQWKWISSPQFQGRIYLQNVGASANGVSYVMDNAGGGTSQGNVIQLSTEGAVAFSSAWTSQLLTNSSALSAMRRIAA